MPGRINLAPLIGAVIAAATDAVYLAVIRHQGPPYDVPRVAAVATVIFAAAAAAGLGSLIADAGAARALLIGASLGLCLVGVLGLLSIGLPLLLAGVLTMVGLARPGRVRGPGPGR